MQIILYLSYMVLIYCVLQFYKNNSEYNLLISSLLITIGIYIINLVVPIKTKENFGLYFSKENGESCYIDSDCKSGHCIKDICHQVRENGEVCGQDNDCKSEHCVIGFCRQVRENGESCRKENDCKSKHCIGGFCRQVRKNGESCEGDNDCNNYIDNGYGYGYYDNQKKCGGDGKCHNRG